MKLKHFLSIALSAAMLFSITGCAGKKQPENTSATALAQMQKINSKNIVDGATDMRIWYEIDPVLFTDRTTGAPGTIRSVIQDLEYLSDGDPKSHEDLNMSGILLNNVLALDDSNTVRGFGQIDPNIGSKEDLQALCSRASSLNMPVMLTLNLASISVEDSQFVGMTDLVNNLQDGEDPYEINPVLMDEFFVEKDRQEENWIQIGESGWYYQALPQSSSPRINMENQVWKQFLINAVEEYFALGVSGFYIEDYSDLFPGDEQKAADFMKWFDEITKERNPNVINVFSYNGWNDPMAEIPAYAADNGAAGAEGMIAKAVTGALSARDLGSYLEDQSAKTQNMAAFFLNNEDGSLDLLKSEARLPQYKMALAVTLMLNGQVFITSGDELGLKSEETDMIVDAIEAPAEESGPDASPDAEPAAGTQVNLQFGSMEEQKENGDSVLNFVQQAVLLRDSYKSISEAPMTLSQELSTDQVLVLDRKTDASETVLVFNLSDQPQTVDTTQITISGLPAELGGVLLTGNEEITKEENILSLPPYSMALLK